MQSAPGSQLSLPERWARALESTVPFALLGLGVASLAGYAVFTTARRGYRVAQVGGVLEVGVDQAKCALPVSSTLYDLERKLSPVLVCTSSEVLHLTPVEPYASGGYERVQVCSWSSIEEIRAQPLPENLLIDLVRGKRYELVLRHEGQETSWKLKPLFLAEDVVRWFSEQGIPARLAAEPQVRWPEPPRPDAASLEQPRPPRP